jgi:hypothetical protein
MKTIWAAVLLFACIISCSPHGIAGSRAYVRESVAGTIRRDDNGRPLNSGISRQYLIYLETNRTEQLPVWQTAWIDQQPFSVETVEVKNTGQIIGKTTDGNDVTVSVKSGNQLWQLLLKPKKEAVDDDGLQKKINSSKILLVGIWKDKPCTYTIEKVERLQALPMP